MVNEKIACTREKFESVFDENKSKEKTSFEILSHFRL